MEQFMLGMISMGAAIASLMFLRFWRMSRDRLFLFFFASFAIEALNRAAFVAFLPENREYQIGYVVARLVSFLLIIFAILDKNSLRQR